MEPRRRDTFSSLQLQRASDQLHEAIQSARQHRSLYSSSATSLSLLSDDDDDRENEEDQENQPFAANAKMTGAADATSAEEKLRRFMRESMGSTVRSNGASLTLKDLLESPGRPQREHRGDSENQQVAGDKGEDLFAKAEPNGYVVPPVTRKLFEDDLVEKQARQALEVIQEQVEAQARANRATQEELKRAVDHISDFVARQIGSSVVSVHEPEPISAESVAMLTTMWRAGLEEWTYLFEKDTQEKMEELEKQTKERVRVLEQAFRHEREGLEAKASCLTDEATGLNNELEYLKVAHSTLMETLVASQSTSQERQEQLQMENEDLRSRIVQIQQLTESIPSAEQQQRHVLNLLSQLKQSELRELQWEMLFEEQSRATIQAQERLGMLLEDTNRSVESSQSSSSVPLSTPDSPRTRRVSLASSAASSELQFYQQRIELLEDQLRDVKEQINCDHHQFLYEQQKWDLTKKNMSHDVEEVHSVSVKVLKLLLIREKLLKKQEKKLQRRIDRVLADEELLQKRHDALLICIDTSLQECGVALLHVRQLAMATPQQSSIPVKPIKLVRVLKRLKTLQQEICGALSMPATSAHEP